MSDNQLTVPPGYACPLCPDHKDTEFVQSRILGVPICVGCAIEISHFIEDDERPNDRVLDRLEAFTGLTFAEYQKIGFEEFIDDFETRLRPENVEAEVAHTRRITKLTRDEVIEHWKSCISLYRQRIRQLEERLKASE